MAKLTATVQGLTCQHCVMTVTSALDNLPGVDDVSVDLVAHGDSKVHFVADDSDETIAQVASTLAQSGYTLTQVGSAEGV